MAGDLTVTKLNAYAVEGASTDLTVTKLNAYAVEGPTADLTAQKLDAYAVEGPTSRLTVHKLVAYIVALAQPNPFPRRLAIQVAMESEFRPEERHFWIKRNPSPVVSRIGPYFFNYVNILPQVAPLILTRHATPGLP